MWAGTRRWAGNTANTSLKAARGQAAYARERILRGYAALPAELGQRLHNIAQSVAQAEFFQIYQKANARRARRSTDLFELLLATLRGTHYTARIKASWRAAGSEMSGTHATGYTFALLKSLRWILQAILWNGAIHPLLMLTGALLGLIAVNLLVFPAWLALAEGIALLRVVIKAVWNAVVSVYAAIAPGATAIAAGLLSALVLVSGQALAAGELFLGSAATAVTYTAGKITAAVVAVGGYATGKTVHYVGAPLAALAIAVVGSVLGVASGAAAAVTGGVLVVAGLAGEAVIVIAGQVAAGGVLVGGYAASLVAAASLVVYDLGKAVLVIVAYELASGLIIAYSIALQLCAHAVLALADVSYLLLSLEGPKWALNSAKGNVN